jgi:anti-anti-sigma factor
MDISTELRGEVLIARTQNRIDGANAREFQDALQAAIDEHDGAMVLDMENLTYISSAGLRVILLIARGLQRNNNNLALCSLSGPVREIFQISGFDKIIATHDSEADAVASVSG